MKSKATFYHAGCPVCVSAESMVAHAIDANRYSVEVVHLGTDKSRLPEAERAGVKSVPALLLDGRVYHINFGASLADVKKA
jgi:glutaredoxin 3